MPLAADMVQECLVEKSLPAPTGAIDKEEAWDLLFHVLYDLVKRLPLLSVHFSPMRNGFIPFFFSVVPCLSFYVSVFMMETSKPCGRGRFNSSKVLPALPSLS